MPSVMNKSPYRAEFEDGVKMPNNALALWYEKTGEKTKVQSNDFILRKGHDVEPKIIAMYELDTLDEFESLLCESVEFPFLKASLDGYCQDTGEILECKMVGAENFAIEKPENLPERFKIQATQHMIITGAKSVTFLLIPTPDAKKGIKADKYNKLVYTYDETLAAIVLDAGIKFWKLVEDKTPPNMADPETAVKITEYFKLVEKMAKLTEKVKASGAYKAVEKAEARVHDLKDYKAAEEIQVPLLLVDRPVGERHYERCARPVRSNATGRDLLQEGALLGKVGWVDADGDGVSNVAGGVENADVIVGLAAVTGGRRDGGRGYLIVVLFLITFRSLVVKVI